jgi:hypothetical protein
MANNKDNNFGLPFDLPDYEDIEAMLDEMVEKENGFRARYKEELIRIDRIRRERQALESSGVPKNSETYITSDAEIRRKEQALTEEYRQLRQQAKPKQPIPQPQPKPQTPRQVQAPQYAQPQRPKAPSYSVNTSESKPVATRTEYKPTRKPETDYESVAGWLLGAGGVAVILWGGISINSYYQNIENQKKVQVEQNNAEYKRISEIDPTVREEMQRKHDENYKIISKQSTILISELQYGADRYNENHTPEQIKRKDELDNSNKFLDGQSTAWRKEYGLNCDRNCSGNSKIYWNLN